MPGLYAAGEILGGIFYQKYPGGASLVRLLVFGRRAGRNAVVWAGAACGAIIGQKQRRGEADDYGRQVNDPDAGQRPSTLRDNLSLSLLERYVDAVMHAACKVRCPCFGRIADHPAIQRHRLADKHRRQRARLIAAY